MKTAIIAISAERDARADGSNPRQVKRDGNGTALGSILFKPEKPIIIFSERATQAEGDDQRVSKSDARRVSGYPQSKEPPNGFRPHEITAAQYLVFIRLLVRRIDESHINAALE